MDKRTLLNAIKTKLVARTWAGSGSVIFGTGSVKITYAVGADTALAGMRVPLALIIPGTFRSDPLHGGQEPDHIVGTVTVRIAQVIGGDHVGEHVVMGANRGDSTKSEGAGLLEIEQEVYSAIDELNVEDSVQIQYRAMGDNGAIVNEQHVYVGYEDLIYEAVCTGK